jgi:hypothetical protein
MVDPSDLVFHGERGISVAEPDEGNRQKMVDPSDLVFHGERGISFADPF